MNRLVKIEKKDDIFEQYKDTPIASLIEYQNLAKEFEVVSKAEILVGMCMDNRKQLHIPNNFAYILRTGGGNLRYSEFYVSYAIASGGIKTIALIAHNNCGMVNLVSKKEKIVQGLVETAGWDKEFAEEHFNSMAPLYEISHEIDFVLAEAKRLRGRYPKILVAPLFYNLEDNLLYLINEV